MSQYPAIWDTIQFHRFEGLTRARIPYIPSWLREFYAAYAQAFPKKRNGIVWMPLEEVEVRGKKVWCDVGAINTALSMPEFPDELHSLRMHRDLVSLKGLLALLTTDSSPSWIEDGAKI